MPAKQCRTYILRPASCILRALASCITDSLVKRNLNHQALHASRTCPAARLFSCHPTDPIGHNIPRPRWILTGLTYTSWQTGVVSSTSPPLHHPPAPGTPRLIHSSRPLLLSLPKPSPPKPPKPPQPQPQTPQPPDPDKSGPQVRRSSALQFQFALHCHLASRALRSLCSISSGSGSSTLSALCDRRFLAIQPNPSRPSTVARISKPASCIRAPDPTLSSRPTLPPPATPDFDARPSRRSARRVHRSR